MSDPHKLKLVSKLPPKPDLEMRLRGKRRSFFSSLGIALLVSTGLASTLALFQVAYKVITKPKPAPPILVENVQDDSPAEANPNKVDFSNPLPTPQPPVSLPPVALELEAPEAIEMPEIPLPPDVLSEIEFDNPFEVKKSEPRPKKTTKKRTPPSKRRVSSRSTTPSKKATKSKKSPSKGKLKKKASVASRARVVYPRSARKKGLQGNVIITVTIGTTGRVSSARITRSSGHGTLDSAALKAARKYRFTPAQNNLGQAISTQLSIPFSFNLKG